MLLSTSSTCNLRLCLCLRVSLALVVEWPEHYTAAAPDTPMLPVDQCGVDVAAASFSSPFLTESAELIEQFIALSHVHVYICFAFSPLTSPIPWQLFSPSPVDSFLFNFLYAGTLSFLRFIATLNIHNRMH